MHDNMYQYETKKKKCHSQEKHELDTTSWKLQQTEE